MRSNDIRRVICAGALAVAGLPAAAGPDSSVPTLESAMQEAEQAIVSLKVSVQLVQVPVWAVKTDPNGRQGSRYERVLDKLDRPEFFRLLDGGKEREISILLRDEEAPL